MVNLPVTIGTINDYMHERNGQKQDRPHRADLVGPKARGFIMWNQGDVHRARCAQTV